MAATLIAQPRRLLEAQLQRRGGHLVFQLRSQFGPPPLEEEFHRAHEFAVPLRGDLSGARRVTAPHLEVQAGAAGSQAAAETQGKEPAQEPQRGAHRPGGDVRAEIPRPVARRPAHDRQGRELLLHREPQEGIGLVVALADVEARQVLLDQRVLEDQGLDLGVGLEPLDGGRLRHEQHGLGALAGGVDVGAKTGAQRAGLADVDHDAVGAAHQVDPRDVGSRPQTLADRRLRPGGRHVAFHPAERRRGPRAPSQQRLSSRRRRRPPAPVP